MPLQTAVNPQTNETVVLIDGAWQKADQIAQHPRTGAKAYFVSGHWMSDANPGSGDTALPPVKERGPIGKVADAVGAGLAAYGEAGAKLASSAAAAPLAGLAGGAAAIQNVYNRATGAPVTTSAGDAVESAQKALTYEPRGRGGSEYVDAVTKPLQILAQGADAAGRKTAEVTGSPALGAAVNTGVNMLPSLIEPGLRAGRAALGKAPAAAPTTPGAPSARSTGGGVANVPTPEAAAAARAEDYARTRLGVDWSTLAPAFKKTLTSIATDASALEKLPVEAVKRQAQLQSLRVPVTTTAAKLSRDSTALRNEANVAATDTGKPIRDVDVQTNRDLRANVEGLRQQVGGVGRTRATAGDTGTAGTAEEVGRQVQERALRTKEAVSKANYNQLYKKARDTNPDATTSTQAIQDLAKVNPAIQHLQWVPSWFKKAATAAGEEGIDQVKLSDLQDLREQAGGIARAGGTDGFHAGQVVKAIDKAMEEVPDTAKAWKDAQKAFREHKNEFENTAAVERNVADKSANDPKTALEDTWKKSIQTAKLEEIRQLKRSLLSGGNAETRLAGKKALRELKQETVNQYLKYITRKTGTNEAGETQITAVQMVEGLKHVGGEARLQEILGNRAVKELKNLIEAAKITKTEPTIRNAGSSTLQNILAFAEKWIDKVPAVGGPLVGGIKVAGKVRELGESARTVRGAVEQPTDRAATRVQSKAKSAKRRATAGQVLKKVAPAASSGLTLRDDTDLGRD